MIQDFPSRGPIRGENETFLRGFHNDARELVRYLAALPLDGQWIRAADFGDFAAGETKQVEHRLGRAFRGFMPLNVRVQPASFRVYLSTDQTGVATSTSIDVEFDTENWDYGSVFNTSTHQFTAPVAGVYQFSTCLFLASFNISRFGGIQLVAGGSTYFGQYNLASDVSGAYIVSASWTLNLAGNDTARVQLFHNKGSDQIIDGGQSRLSWFSGEIVGSPVPYIDSSALDAEDPARYIPIHAERPLTCDLWVY